MSVPPSMVTETPSAAETSAVADPRLRPEHPAAEPQLPTRNAALSLLLRLGEATASTLADRLGVSVQVMRRHLRGLQSE
jgi:DeoR family suf operon transcriptional repressor